MQEERPPEKDRPTVGEEFRETLGSRARILSSFLIDSLLLGIGIAVLWTVQYIGDRLELHGVARWYWTAIEIILGGSSILGVLLYVLSDLRRLYRGLFPGKEGKPS